MNVLVFTPVLRLEPETVAAIMALEWDGGLTLMLQRDNPHEATAEVGERTTGVRNHLHQYRRGRRLFLAGDWDAMLVIESDIIPPPNTLKRLAALDVDLAYGCYMFRNSPVVNVFERYPEKGGRPARNQGESLTVRGLWRAALGAGVVDCSGAGLGCVLIKRRVLEAVDFRASTMPTAAVHCDSWFTGDVYRAGFSMKADTGVICGHKREDGVVLWPEVRDA